MVAVLQADELPQDVAGAEALLTSHSEHKAEIDARQDSFTSFKKKAEALITARHYASQEVVVNTFILGANTHISKSNSKLRCYKDSPI